MSSKQNFTQTFQPQTGMTSSQKLLVEIENLDRKQTEQLIKFGRKFIELSNILGCEPARVSEALSTYDDKVPMFIIQRAHDFTKHMLKGHPEEHLNYRFELIDSTTPTIEGEYLYLGEKSILLKDFVDIASGAICTVSTESDKVIMKGREITKMDYDICMFIMEGERPTGRP